MPHAVIRVAGGGPSGLACAITLARGGLEVEVHEALDTLGGRFDGDHQVIPCFGDRPAGLELLKSVDVDLAELEHTPLHDACFYDKTSRQLDSRSEQAYALLIRRGPDDRTLDSALIKAARRAGVQFVTGSRLDASQANIVATGPAAVDGVALERMFRTDASDRVDILFDTRLTPGGYAYMFIQQGLGTVGVAALGAYKHLDPMMERALERFRERSPFRMEDTRQASHYMNFAVPHSAVQDGRFYVGEAGGFQNYLFGLGLRMAMMSGRLAGEALLTGADYDLLWKRTLRRRMLLSAVDRFLYERWPRNASSLLDRLKGRDLLDGLNELQADVWPKQLLLRWVRRRWLQHESAGGQCRHNLDSHLCRPKMVIDTPPALGAKAAEE